ncbi:MAG: heme-binding protein [Gemmatimonadales bacterium]|nr:heme-binding protein [Gemmatimonadales bacterium]
MSTRSAPQVTLEAARRIAEAGEAEAREQGWHVTIAIVDAAGDLVLLQRDDQANPASVANAEGKARTSARFRRTTKVLEDAIAAGRPVLMTFPGIVPVQGGVPIEVNGQVVGAVGVSGATSAQDEQVARAGIGAM